MTARRDHDLLIRTFLDEGQTELPDRAYDAVRAEIDQTRQRVVIGPWREQQMTRFAILGAAATAIVLAAVVGLRFLPSDSGIGVGGQPTPTANPTARPTPPPTPTAVPSATSVAEAQLGRLDAGTYVVHPFAPPNESMSFTFSVPSDSWEGLSWPGLGKWIGLIWSGDTRGVGVGFLRVTGMNGDPCNWSGTEDDVEIGPTVDDLVSALQAETEYSTSEADDVTLGGYSGKKVILTWPSSLEPGGNAQIGCDDLLRNIWDESNAEGFDLHAQGPENLWTLYILDVAGERVVILRSEFADSAPERRQQLDSIVNSIVITAP